MTDNTENLVLAHLRQIRATVGKMWSKTNDLKQQIIGVRKQLNAFDSAFIRADEHFARMSLGLDRIEKRVGLIGA